METRRRWGFRRVGDEMHRDEAVEMLLLNSFSLIQIHVVQNS